jgi:hypothetical protein
LEARILNNEALPIRVRENLPLKLEDLDPEIIQSPDGLTFFCNIKIKDLIHNNVFISKHIFCGNIHINVSRQLWDKLDRIRRLAYARYGTGTDLTKKGRSLLEFFLTWKGGSKKIRKILTGIGKEEIMHNMIKFAENTETVINYDLAAQLNIQYGHAYLYL